MVLIYLNTSFDTFHFQSIRICWNEELVKYSIWPFNCLLWQFFPLLTAYPSGPPNIMNSFIILYNSSLDWHLNKTPQKTPTSSFSINFIIILWPVSLLIHSSRSHVQWTQLPITYHLLEQLWLPEITLF